MSRRRGRSPFRQGSRRRDRRQLVARLVAIAMIVGLGSLGTARAEEAVAAPATAKPTDRVAHERVGELRATPVDVATTRRILAEARVETDPAQPGLGTYVQDVGAAFGRLLSRLAARLAPRLSGLIRLFSRVDPRVVWAVVVALGLFVAWRLASRRRPPAERAQTRVEPVSPGAAKSANERDWDAVVAARLAAGDVFAALEALWWWLAMRLGATAAESSWTSRELVTRAQRADLLPAVRTLDRLAYGSEVPAVDDVRRFRDRLAELLG